MEDSTIRHRLEALSSELAAFEPLLTETLEDQWQRGSVDSIRKLGQQPPSQEHPQRPTEDIVSDDRRLRLRATVQAAGEALEAAHIQVRASRLALERAHRRWKGLHPDQDV